MNFRIEMTIGGRPASTNQWFDVLNPANEQVIGQAPDCAGAMLDEAVTAARRAFGPWRSLPFSERAAYLVRMTDRIEAHIDELKRMLTLEQGKTLAAAESDIGAGVHWLREIATLTLPETVVEDGPDRAVLTQHVAIGVVGAIAPWNVPVALAIWKIAPALLAGNTVILKPSPFTPLTTLRIGELLATVLPEGVLNVVSGGDALGPMITEHRGIDKISFTGSSATGRKVMRSAAGTLKRITLELGGNDPAIVLADADVELAARTIFQAAFGNTGQVCVATKRVYAHASIYDRLAQALVALAGQARIGDGAEEGTDFGPVQNRAQYARVTGLIRDSIDSGHTLLAGGLPAPGAGYFVPLTIVDNPPRDARIVVEEQFGPVLPLLCFDDLDEVIAEVNGGEYGLGASVFSSNPEAARAVADRLETGTVWINHPLYLTPFQPFGGHKQSGLGIENAIDGLLEYTNVKTTVIARGPDVAPA